MDSVTQPGLGPSTYPSDIASRDSLPPKGLPETQQIGETGHAAGAAEGLSTYKFPRQRLKQVQTDSSREPLVLVACGLSPLHVSVKVFTVDLNFLT